MITFQRIGNRWGYHKKEKILNIIADGKCIITYKKIVDINSLAITPENEIYFEKSEFYSDLK